MDRQQLPRRTALAMIAGGGIGLLLPGGAGAQERRAITAKFEVKNERIMFAVGMNGTGPYTFMLDTGMYVSFVRPELAKRLKLPVHGIEFTTGVAGKRTPFTTYVASDFIIGGAFRQPSVVLQDSFRFGVPDIDGALAAGMVTAFDTDLDFDAGELRIYPDGRGSRTGYTAVASSIPQGDGPNRGSRRIYVTVMLDGRPVRCILDTGCPYAMLLNRSVAERLGYWNDARPFAPHPTRGIGGAGNVGRFVRGDSLVLAETRTERPLVFASGNDLDGFEGLLGLPFIRRLNLSIDPSAGRLWIAPSRQLPGVQRYSGSGLWLDRKGATAEVAIVGTGSPATAAGVRVGDRVAGNWPDLLRTINGPPGSTVTLDIVRGGNPQKVEFVLASYL